MRLHPGFALLLAFSLHDVVAQASPDPLPRLTASQATRDLKILESALTALHPGLYRYRTPAEIDAEFATANAAVAGGADAGRLYLLASHIAASVRCGHTWTNPLNQSDALQRALFARADKLPLRLRRVDGRMLVVASSDPAVAAGSELLAIDGRGVDAIVAELLPYLRADGGSDGKRYAQIDSDANGGAMDRLFPLLHPPVDGRYALRLREAHGRVADVSVAAVSSAARDAALAASGIAAPDEDWRLVVDGDTAVWTLPTFAFFRSAFDWRQGIRTTFDTLRQRRVRFLILDLRLNEGGDGAIGDAVLAQLLRSPYVTAGSRAESAYERVPYALARYLDTWDFTFFDRTGKVLPGPARNYVVSDRGESARTNVPVDAPFAGRTIALVGPEMSSAGFILARQLQDSGAALLLGRATGGNRRGLNGGELAWVTLPNSGVAVDIPLLAWMSDTPQPDAPVEPDRRVEPRFEDAVDGVDTELVAARAQVSAWRRTSRGK